MSVSHTSFEDSLLLCINLDAILIYLECICKFFLISSQLQTRKMWLFQKSSQICRPWHYQSGELPWSIKTWPYQWLDHTTYRSILIILHWDSEFIHQYASYFEIQLKPLWKFLKQYYCKPIPLMSWTPQLITLFYELKHGVKSSQSLDPVLPW